MVSGAAIACMVISTVVAFGLPVALFLGFRKRLGLRVVPMLVGAMVFILFALVLEQFLHAFVLRPDADGKIALVTQNPLLYVTYGVLAAGVFEETGRLVGFTLLKRRYARVRTAVSYGIGHGGIEAILVLGLAMISNIALAAIINGGQAASALASLPPETALAVTESLTQTPPVMFLIGALERVLAMIVQLSLSVLVWVAVTHAGRRWLFPLAIVLHAIVNVPVTCYQVGLLPLVWVEGILLVSALALGAYAVWWIRRCVAEDRLAADAAA